MRGPDHPRRALVAALTLLVALPRPAGASDEEPTPPRTVTTEPLAIVFARAFALEFEGRVGEGWTLFVQPSVVVGASRLTGADPDAPDRGFGGYGLGLTAGFRFFPFDVGPEGFFLSVFGSGAWATSSAVDGASVDGAGFGAGAMAGYTFILGGSFVLSLGAGAAYAEVHPSGAEVRREAQPAVRAGLGVAF
jgi:hypothetical protein